MVRAFVFLMAVISLAACRLDELQDFGAEASPALSSPEPTDSVKPPRLIPVSAWWTWLGCERPGGTNCDADELPGQMIWVDAFAMDETEVTVEQYAACVEVGACSARGLVYTRIKGRSSARPSPSCNWGAAGREQHPLNCVTWFQARAYCKWRNARLPREEQWERASRNLDLRRYPWGDEEPGDEGGPRANLADKQLSRRDVRMDVISDYDDGFALTAPVGSFPAGRSPTGFHDLAGNVWEWTRTSYEPYPGNDDPLLRSQADGSTAVLRGGCWSNPSYRARCANRGSAGPWSRDPSIGFRCVRER